MQICQTYSIKKLIRYVKRNFIENMLTLSEMSNVKIFRLISTTESMEFSFLHLQKQLLQSPTSRPFMTFLPNWCGFFMVFCVFVRDVCKSKIKATHRHTSSSWRTSDVFTSEGLSVLDDLCLGKNLSRFKGTGEMFYKKTLQVQRLFALDITWHFTQLSCNVIQYPQGQ